MRHFLGVFPWAYFGDKTVWIEHENHYRDDMKTKKDIKYILDEMNKLFGNYPATELFYETPFQLLLAVILSAQTTDKQVNKVTKTLFKKIKTPADLVKM